MQRRVQQGVVAPQRDAAHAFHPGADEHLAGAHRDRPRRDVHRLHRTAAEPIHRHARDRDRQIRQQPDQPPDIHALLALREGAPHDDVLDIGRVHRGALDQAADHLRRQVVRAHPRQRPLLRQRERGPGIPRDDDILRMVWHGRFPV
jgi:hypothetical protein